MKSRILTSSLCLLGLGGAQAAVVLQTGFETTDTPAYALGQLPTTSTLPVYDQNNQGTRTILDDSTASPFGPDNQFLALGGANLRVRSNGVTPLTTISFDFFEPSGVDNVTRFGFGSSDLNGAGAFINWGLNNGAISAQANTALVGGSAPTLLEDRHYLAQILLNNSASAETVSLPGGGSFELAAGTASLMFYDTVANTLIDGGTYEHSASVTPSTFFFRGFGAEGNLIYIDNFTRSNDLVVLIPEPSVALLGGLGLLGLLRRRR